MADDLLEMQRQAARRVQRMQEHSRQVFEQHRERPTDPVVHHRPPDWPEGVGHRMASPGLYSRPVPPPEEKTPPACPPPPEDTLALPGGLDSEQWLLLGLALLLFRCGNRPELILALLYLALD